MLGPLQEDEDQLDLLITLEEYCGGKGLFAGDSGSGDLYVPIFGNVLWELYDMDIITEDVFLDWESQKLRDEADEAEEQVLSLTMHGCVDSVADSVAISFLVLQSY